MRSALAALVLAALALAALALAALAAGASAQDVRRESVLEDFVPDLSLLERVPSGELEDVYSGKTFAGLYQVPFRDDQRFVEAHLKDGRSDYREGAAEFTGRWSIEDRKLCYRYVQDDNRAHCWTMYRYGGCFVAYEHAHPITGDPLFLRNWGYIQKEVDADFAWPERAINDDDVFTCEFAVS